MTKVSKKTDFKTWLIRWIARGLSTLFFIFFMSVVIGDWSAEIERGYKSFNFGTLGLILLIAVVGIIVVLLGWLREGIGGFIQTIGGLAVIIVLMLTLPPRDYWVTPILGGPFLVSGILYLICGRRIKKSKIPKNSTVQDSRTES